MRRVMTAPLAVLLQLDAIRIVLLVLLGRVIAALAISAGQSDQRSDEFSSYRLRVEIANVLIHMHSPSSAAAGAHRALLLNPCYWMICVKRP